MVPQTYTKTACLTRAAQHDLGTNTFICSWDQIEVTYHGTLPVRMRNVCVVVAECADAEIWMECEESERSGVSRIHQYDVEHHSA